MAQLREGRTDWYRIKNVASGPAQVMIYDEIGYFGVTANDFVRDLAEVDATEIELHISSPGGEIFDGIAIMTALRTHKARVTTYVDSLAASIASVIAMAGDRIIMGRHSEMMIHDGMGVAVGNASDMREMIDILDRQSDKIAGIYAERAGGDVAEWRKRMKAETWYSADEAVEAGLADEVAGEDEDEVVAVIAAKWDLSVFAYSGREQAPAPLAACLTEPAPPAPPVADPPPALPFDAAAFRAAAKVTEPAPPEFPADYFRTVIANTATDLPEPAPPAQPPVPAAEPEPTFDRSAFRRALWEARL